MVDKTQSEDDAQMHFVSWFRKQYDGVRIFAIPNGGARHPAVAMKLKLTGVTRGVPDLYVPAWGLWIEMKREGTGRLSPAQLDWLEYLDEIGDTTMVCYGLEDAKRQVLLFHPM